MNIQAGDKIIVTSYGARFKTVAEKVHNGLVWYFHNGRKSWSHLASVEKVPPTA